MKNSYSFIAVLITVFFAVSCASDREQQAEESMTNRNEGSIRYGEPVSDSDGNTYRTVIIGEQEWMAENLKATTYSNGEPIDYPGDDDAAWRDNTNGAYAWYNNDQANGDAYGALYNWFAVDNPNGLCPDGWRVPDHEDWLYLTDYVGDEMGNQLKSRRQVGSPFGGEYDTMEHPRWETFSANYGYDAFGFGALPAGNRHASGTFVTKGANALFWSSSVISETAGYGWYIYHAITVSTGATATKAPASAYAASEKNKSTA